MNDARHLTPQPPPAPTVATADPTDIVVYACPTKAGTQLRYHCPCGRVHLHGRAQPGDGTTPYRQSHCREPGSPLYDREYLLIEVPPDDPRLMPPPRGRPKRS